MYVIIQCILMLFIAPVFFFFFQPDEVGNANASQCYVHTANKQKRQGMKDNNRRRTKKKKKIITAHCTLLKG